MDLDEMNRLARALWAVAAEESEETQIAIAWLARNKIGQDRLSVRQCCAFIRALSGDTVPPSGKGRRVRFDDIGFCRALAVTCEVWLGSYTDPTRGATLAHRHHDEAPAWAEQAKGTALIGPWLFYRAL